MNPLRDPSLTISLLGPPRVCRSETALWEGRLDRPLALLSYLVAQPGTCPREELAALFWPDKESRTARANLSTAFYNIETRLGISKLFEATPRAIGWRAVDLPWDEEPVDLRRYLREDPPPGCSRFHFAAECLRCRERIEAQREMGLRPFLEGCSFSSMGSFGNWALSLRAKLSLRQRDLERQLSSSSSFFPSSPRSALPLREIRQITFLSVLFSGFSTKMDPEEVMEVQESFLDNVASLVRGFGGEVRSGMGGVLHVIFGFFKNLEDPTRRAVLAAREIRALSRADARLRQGEVRLAILTGEGLADLSTGDPDPVGDRIREVDRIVLQSPPGAIVATWETVRLVDRFFRVEKWEAHPKAPEGSERPLFLIGEDLPPSRQVEVDFVGRRTEKARMEKLLKEGREAGGLRTLWITGEAGIGKSALLNEFIRLFRKVPGDAGVRQIFCLSGDPESPYSSVIRFLRSHVGIEERTPPKEARYYVERYLLSTGQPLGENISLLLHLLCGEGPWTKELAAIAPEHLHSRLDSLILSILLWRSIHPFLIAIEDLHWIDQNTTELLKKTIVALRGSHALLVLTARDEETLHKMGLPPPDEILRLSALSRAESREMIELLAPGSFSPSTLKAGIDRGGGIPLYLRELVLSGTLSGGSSEIPANLKELLSSRIGSLGESRTMAKVAACLGESVDWPLLLRATESYASLPSGERSTDAWIEELLNHKILEAERLLPDPTYRFRHALLREGLLKSLPGSVRKKIHRVLAEVLQEEFPSQVSRQPEILGEHLEKAGLTSKAVPRFISAGDRSAALGAYRIALDHFGKALALLESEPSSPDIDSRILRLLLSMLRIVNVVSGYGPESEKLRQKAQDLVRKHPDSPLEPELSLLLLESGGGSRGPEWTLETLESLPRTGNRSGSELWADCLRGMALFWKGELDQAFSALSAVREEFVRHGWQNDSSFENYPESPPVLIYSYLGFICQLQGRVRESRAIFDEGARLDDVLRLPRSRVYLGVFATYARCMAQDVATVRKLAKEPLRLAEEVGLQLWEEVLRMALLWCDPSEEASRKAEELMLAIREMIPGVSPIFYSLRAEMALKAGLWDKAVEMARIGREEGEKVGTRVFDPLFFVVEGQALLGKDPGEAGERAKGLFEVARKRAEETGALWHGLMAEVELVALGLGDRRRFASLLGRVSGGEDLPLVVRARHLLETKAPNAGRGRKRK